MKRIFWLAVQLLAVCSLPAAADSITLVNVGTNTQGGVYVAPYFLTINGGPQLTVMCDDYTHAVTLGQQWFGHTSNFSDLSHTRNGSGAVQQYDEIAWLFQQYLSHPNQAGDINFAVWSIFTPSVIGGTGWTPGAATWLNLATTHNYSNFNTTGFMIITPDDLSPKGPQEYITQVPEPGGLLLLGSGLLGMAVIARKRLIPRITS